MPKIAELNEFISFRCGHYKSHRTTYALDRSTVSACCTWYHSMPIDAEIDMTETSVQMIDGQDFGLDPYASVGSSLPPRLRQTQLATCELRKEPGNTGVMSPRMTSDNIEKLCHELRADLTR